MVVVLVQSLVAEGGCSGWASWFSSVISTKLLKWWGFGGFSISLHARPKTEKPAPTHLLGYSAACSHLKLFTSPSHRSISSLLMLTPSHYEVMTTMPPSLILHTPSSPQMNLFLHHHPIGTVIYQSPSPKRRRSAIHAGHIINSILWKTTMTSCAFLWIKSYTRIIHYPFNIGNNHESEDLEKSASSALLIKVRVDSIIAGSRSNSSSSIYFYKGSPN